MHLHQCHQHLGLTTLQKRARNGQLSLTPKLKKELLETKTLECPACPHGKACHRKPDGTTTRIQPVPVLEEKENTHANATTAPQRPTRVESKDTLLLEPSKLDQLLNDPSVLSYQPPQGPATEQDVTKIHADVWGPVTPSYQQGYTMTLGLYIYPKGFLVLVGLKHQTGLAMYDGIKTVVELAKKFGHRVHIVVTDNYPSFDVQEIDHYLREEGIIHQHSIPHKQHGNGPIERQWRTLGGYTITVLAESGLSDSFWWYAKKYKVFVKNRDGDPSPFQKMFHMLPSPIQHAPFGCEVLCTEPKHLRRGGKLKSYVRRGIFLGNAQNYKAAVYFLDMKTGSVLVRGMADTSFITDSFPAKLNQKVPPSVWKVPAQDDEDVQEEHKDEEENIRQVTRAKLRERPTQTGPAFSSHEYEAQLRRDKAKSTKGKDLALVTKEEDEEPDPLTEEEAKRQKDAPKWLKAKIEEIENHIKNGTWEVERVPNGKKTIKYKWVFKKKRDRDGNVDRYKARLVARGYSQILGVDYEATYAPTMGLISLRILVSTAAHRRWKMVQIDVVAAYLRAKLPDTEVLYMDAPEGMEIPAGHALRLRKCIYGLKQSARYWNKDIHNTLVGLGYEPSQFDPCVYLKYEEEELVATLGLYVDDILCCGEDKDVDKTIAILKKVYDITGGDEPDFVLGIAIDYNREQGTIALSQKAYVDMILKRYNMNKCHAAKTPASMQRLTKPEQEATKEEKERMERVPYRSAIGSLLFVARGTRPDIYYAVAQAGRFGQDPRPDHWTAVKRIFRYLQGTRDLGIIYSAEDESAWEPEVWADADWAGDQDDRRSTSGRNAKVLGGALFWKSQKQRLVAQSSAESEVVSIVETTNEVLWLRKAMRDLRYDVSKPTVINEDNQGCIAIAENNRGMSSRTKHFETKYFAIRSHVESGAVKVEYCPTEDMLADMFTKPLGPTKFLGFRARIGIYKIRS